MSAKIPTTEVEERLGQGPFGMSDKEQQQKKIFICTFAMLAQLAGADGAVGKKEVLAVDHFMKNVLELDPERRSFAVSAFNESRKTATTFKEYAEQYREILSDRPKMYEWMIDILLQISGADGVFSEAEERLIITACEVFAISRERYQQLKISRLKSKAEAAYKILGCSAQCDDDEIRKKYLRLKNDYDPIRIKQFSLVEDFVQLAETKTAEIEQAYQLLKHLRGFPS